MYVKIDEINVILDAVEDDMTGKELSLYLKGKLNPIAQFNPEQAAPVDETKAEEPVKKNNPFDFKPGRGGIIEMLQEMADDLRKGGIDVPPFPTSPFGSFADFMQRRARHTENAIKLEYEKHEAVRFAREKNTAVEEISADFIQKFKEKFNGLPSPKLFDQIKDDIAGSLIRYRKSVNAGNPKAMCLEFQFSPNLGKCPCPTCTITPLN